MLAALTVPLAMASAIPQPMPVAPTAADRPNLPAAAPASTPPQSKRRDSKASAPRTSGPLSAVAAPLVDSGIYLRGVVVSEFAGSVSGGVKRGAADSIAMPFGADIDLDRMVGIKGGSLHVTFNASVGHSLNSEFTGSSVSFQTRYKSVHNLRLAVFSYEQKLLHDKVDLLVGRLSPLSDFNQSPLYCQFQNNASCFNPAVVPIQDKALNFFPYGTWGGRIKVRPNARTHVTFGAYEANPSLIPTNGFDWSTRNATGVELLGEAGVQSAPGAATAWHLLAGVYHNSSSVADPYYNKQGLPLASAGGTAWQHDGQTGWYLSGDIVVGHLGSDPRRPLSVFASSVNQTDAFSKFSNEAIVGVVAKGLLAARPQDALGFMASYERLGQHEVYFLNAARRAAGGSEPVHRGEAIMELNYGIKATPTLEISPNVQYVLHPDNALAPRRARASGDILAFGVRVTLNVGRMLGFPAMPK